MMKFVRRFEEIVYFEFTKPGQKIGGFVHLASGQEAIAVGVAEVHQRDKDFLIANVRHHAHSLALGLDPVTAAGELFGHKSGCCRGKGGSMHLFNAPVGDLGGILRAGGQLPLGIGAAFSCAYRNSGGVCFILFGDGSVNTGAFAESMNLASLWKLPAVFILENNGVTIGTKVGRACADPDLSSRADAYAMPGHRIDGNDVEAVVAKVAEAANRARRGLGPTYIAADTYRLHGHSMSDAVKYRTRNELQEARKRDPIKLYSERLRRAGSLTEAEEEQLTDAVAERVAAAFDIARCTDHPHLSERFADVTADAYPLYPHPK